LAIKHNKYKINAKYIIITGVAVLLSWVLHELAHWLTGTLLGYRMAMTLNASFPLEQHFSSDQDYQIVSAAGPLFTLVEALVIFVMMRRKRIPLLYPFLFTCFYMRLLAAILSFFNPNDEARISRSLGLSTFTLPIISVALFSFLVYKISQLYAFNKKFNIITLILIIFFSSVIILSDQFFHIRLL